MLLDIHGWLSDLLEAHLEHLDFLWPRWEAARASAEYMREELRQLEERLEANLDALVLAGDEARLLVEAGWSSESRGTALASALVTLRQGQKDRVEALLGLLPAAPVPTALAICEAVAFAPADAPVDDALAALLESRSAAAVVGAADALLLRGRSVASPERFVDYLETPDGTVRAVAWRVVGDLSARGLIRSPDRSVFEAAFAEVGSGGAPGAGLGADATAGGGTAEAALRAAAWSRQRWLLSSLRQAATREVKALEWLGRLGGPEDLGLILEAMRREELGPLRFLAAARLGHAEVASALVELCSDPRPERAVPAAHALWRITNQRRNLDETAAIVGPDGDPDLAETAHLPDAVALRQWWHEARRAFPSGPRWARGLDVAVTEETGLDCAASADRVVREVFEGRRRPEEARARQDRFPLG